MHKLFVLFLWSLSFFFETNGLSRLFLATSLRLMNSSSFSFQTLLTILLVMLTFQATNENLPPNVIKQLAKELKSLDESPPEGIKVGVNDDDFSIIYADIEGPGMYHYFLT